MTEEQRIMESLKEYHHKKNEKVLEQISDAFNAIVQQQIEIDNLKARIHKLEQTEKGRY